MGRNRSYHSRSRSPLRRVVYQEEEYQARKAFAIPIGKFGIDVLLKDGGAMLKQTRGLHCKVNICVNTAEKELVFSGKDLADVKRAMKNMYNRMKSFGYTSVSLANCFENLDNHGHCEDERGQLLDKYRDVQKLKDEEINSLRDELTSLREELTKGRVENEKLSCQMKDSEAIAKESEAKVKYLETEMKTLKERNTKLAEKGVKNEKDVVFYKDIKQKYEELVKTKAETEDECKEYKKLYKLREKEVQILKNMMKSSSDAEEADSDIEIMTS